MATRVKGVYDGYSEMLKGVSELSDKLYCLDYGLNDLGFFGFDSDSIKNEWEHYKLIEQALSGLQDELNKALGNNGEQ